MTNAGRKSLIQIIDLPMKQREISLRPTVKWEAPKV